MTGTAGTVKNSNSALKEAAQLLASHPLRAAEMAQEIVRNSPDNVRALLLLGVARRNHGAVPAALDILAPLAAANPEWALVHYELGVTYGRARQVRNAVAALRYALARQPNIGEGWLLLADHMLELGDPASADLAYANHLAVATCTEALLEPAKALCQGNYAEAERLLRAHLEANPTDAPGMRMLAEVLSRLGRLPETEAVLARCLEVAPDFVPARHNYAVTLAAESKTEEALAEIDKLVAVDPANPSYRNLQATALTQIGRYDQAVDAYAAVLANYPGNAKIWLPYGHALKIAGRLDEGIKAYRRAIELAPSLGEAYFSLANLKTFRFTDGELDAIRTQLARADLWAEDRMHFHFALGKALEDAKDYAESFRQYAEGNRVRLAGGPPNPYVADETTDHVRRSKALFTESFLRQREGWGCPDRDPIFVIGMPRAGSTLVEQILASHSSVEGTKELTDVAQIVVSVVDEARKKYGPVLYPEVLERLDADEFRALGERYLQHTRVHRGTNAPIFIDKMPNNWPHLGLIHLMLPNARIVDARRHPMSCCFSNFKQHFARGQYFSNSLEDMGRYYRDYVDLMAHFDRVLPGRVHRVIYERMVHDTEAEVRRLLAYCGLPFEEACLRFYENERAVHTPSSEQVRQPIYQEGVDQWRHYEPWLGPLREALGPVLDSYPDDPPG